MKYNGFKSGGENMSDQDIILDIETRISTILENLNQLAHILQECKDQRGWTNYTDPITGKVCKVDEALEHIYTAHSEIAAIDVSACEIECE
ncbi:MAG: hypothetical protein PWQ67_309 [Clostridia bacterium]|jgi:hypothetical protein|nr:hypothetical protein [Clostridia bacterium]MDN5321855.1 hypothetical protein [Clostridia bacterium]